MAEMAVAFGAKHLGPHHAVADVALLIDMAVHRGRGEAWPAAAGIEFGVGFEQGLAAAGAGIGALALLMLVLFNLADSPREVGRTSEARSTFDEAARVATESGRSDLASDATRRRDSIKVSDSSPSQAQPSSTPAEAASGDELAARALFEEGRALRGARRTEDACQKFEASSKRFTSAGVVFNLGDCYEKLGRTASAWTAFRDAASLAGKPSASTSPRKRARA